MKLQEALHQKDIQLLVGSALLIMASTVINAGDFAVDSISDNSTTFGVSVLVDETTSFGSKIFNHANKNGRREQGENGITGVTVKLIDRDGHEINVESDDILGAEDDSPRGVITNEEGSYSFLKITQNFYRIQVEVE